MNLYQLNYLVVDDIELMRAVTVNQLRGMGCEKIKVARHGAEALDMLRLGKFDVVLSDWNMPVMSGLDLLKAIRADAKLANMPFLMITAEAERQRIEMVIAAGVDGLLVKPYTVGNLISRLERIFKPQTRPTHKPVETPPKSEMDGLELEAVISPSRILVVDDYPVSLKLLEQLFKDEYQVLTAVDGQTALALCQSNPPDLVLMDVQMPGMDGFEVVRRLREQPATAQMPVIFVTGLADDEARIKGMELGAVDFVSKTSDPKALRSRVRNFIQLVDMRRKLQVDYDAMLDAARVRQSAENISRHDLKGFLAGIVGMVQTMASDNTMAPGHIEQLRLVQKIAEQTMNMVNLAGELYKIEMGQFKLKAVAVNVGEILHCIVDLFRSTYSDKRLTIEVDTDTPVGTEYPQALGDVMLCYSLFQNLLKNACEAALPDTRVVVTLKDETPLRIVITNSGVVPVELRGRFFEKFATSGKVGGSGIGTYSAQMMTKAQNGSLTMTTSDEHNSTELTVTLPRHTFEPAPSTQ